jgi:integrase
MKITKHSLKTGVRYRVRVSYQARDPLSGKTRQRELERWFRTSAEARAWQVQHEHARNEGRLRKPKRQTLDQFLDQWLAGLTGIAGRTLEDYQNLTRRYWRPTLGERRLDQLTTADVRQVLAVLAKPKAEGGQGLRPRTVAYARSVLRLALNTAIADGLLLVNPACGKNLVPKADRRELSVLSGVQVRQLLDATRDDAHGPLWALVLLTGMRPSEALGLRWADVRFDRGEVQVLRKLRRPHNGSTWVLEACKTTKSQRSIPLIAEAVEALQRHRDRQAVERLVAGEGYHDHSFVFAEPDGEPWRRDGVYKYHWLPMLKRLGLPRVALKDARHSCATMLLESGVPMKVVQEILGHASMTLTADTYSHVTPAFKRQAADALAAHLAA